MRLPWGSNPVLASGLDLFPVVTDSTLPRFVSGCLLPLRGLNHVSFVKNIMCLLISVRHRALIV